MSKPKLSPETPGEHPRGSSQTRLMRADANASVVALNAWSSRLRMQGHFHPAWMASLCGGLSDHHVSIERAHATRESDGSWVAELDLVPSSHVDLESIPYATLADAEPATDAGGLWFSAFSLGDSPDHGGTLKFEFDAPDSLGLLGKVLGMLAMMSLFPAEMRIETRAGLAHDTLWLSGLGRAAPSRAARQNLERCLNGKLLRSSARPGT